MDSFEEIFTKKIREADMVLVGLGEEFDQMNPSENAAFAESEMMAQNLKWLIPAFKSYDTSQDAFEKREKKQKALRNLAELLGKKNYYILSVSQSKMVSETKWREGRLVMPCGTVCKKQCEHGCAEEEVTALTEEEKAEISRSFERFEVASKEVKDFLRGDAENMPPEVRVAMKMIQKKEAVGGAINALGIDLRKILGKCERCGGNKVFNVLQAEKYDEKGYLKDWDHYAKWLYGSMSRKLVVIELGTAESYPGLFKNAFEKITSLNPKASHFALGAENFENVIDWLAKL